MKVDNPLSSYKLSISSPLSSPKGGAAVAKTDPGSTIVKLSIQALGQGLLSAKQKEEQDKGPNSNILDTLKKITEDMKTQKKAAARARIQLIKQQIDGMIKFASALTPDTAKQVANQIRQLAQQLKMAAAELMDNGGSAASAVSVNIPTELGQAGEESGGGAEAEAAAAQAAASAADAEEEAKAASGEASDKTGESSDEAATDNPVAGQKSPGISQNTDKEREADKALIQEVAKKLKVLFSLVRAQLKDGDNKDVKETESVLREIDKLMSDGEGVSLNFN